MKRKTYKKPTLRMLSLDVVDVIHTSGDTLVEDSDVFVAS